MEEMLRLVNVVLCLIFADRVMNMYGDLEGELHCVSIPRRPGETMGFAVMGHRDDNIMATFVCRITQDGPVARDGRLHIGDELLEVTRKYPFQMRLVLKRKLEK